MAIDPVSNRTKPDTPDFMPEYLKLIVRVLTESLTLTSHYPISQQDEVFPKTSFKVYN